MPAAKQQSHRTWQEDAGGGRWRRRWAGYQQHHPTAPNRVGRACSVPKGSGKGKGKAGRTQ